jgi:hypothetical protein
MTPEQLDRACALIRTGRGTLEASIRIQIGTTHSSIYRSRDAGISAIEAEEAGEELNEEQQIAANWWRAIDSAMAEAEFILTRQVLGDPGIVVAKNELDGTTLIASTKHSAYALEVLKVTRKHWRIPADPAPVAPQAPVEAPYDKAGVRAWLASQGLPFPGDEPDAYDPETAAPANVK